MGARVGADLDDGGAALADEVAVVARVDTQLGRGEPSLQVRSQPLNGGANHNDLRTARLGE